MKALVTGATGFLGGALARRLHRMGWDVTATGRNLEAGKRLEEAGLRFRPADLTDQGAIFNLCIGRDMVFHCGGLASFWGWYQDFYDANVTGTENIVAGCLQHGVSRLIHVSTPSIYFGEDDSRLNVREDAPLPEVPINDYVKTKLLAEASIDEAHEQGLPVVTVRPRALFGPGDRAILPRVIARLAQRRLPIIGDGENLTDLTYIENAVDALILCAEAPPGILGKKYNITNGEPVKVWPMIHRLCDALGYPYPPRKVPVSAAYKVAATLENIARLLPNSPEPPLTRYTVSILSNSATLDIGAAKRDLGYVPRVTMDQGFERFVAWWKEMHPVHVPANGASG